MDTEKIKDHEKSVLGAIIIKNDMLHRVSEEIEANDFLYPVHQKVYRAMWSLDADKSPIDEVTLSSKLKEQGYKDDDYIMLLSENAPVADNAIHYAKIVKSESSKRKLNIALKEANKKNSEDAPVQETLEELRKDLDVIANDTAKHHIFDFNQLMMEEYKVLEKKSNGEVIDERIATGFTDLDRILGGGLQYGQFGVIGARPAMGKSSLAVHIGINIAQRGIPVLFISIEMPKEQITRKVVSIASEIPYQAIVDGNLEGAQWDKLFKATNDYGNIPFYIDDESSSEFDIVSSIRKAHRELGVKVVFIDYLQRVRIKPKNNRFQELGEFAEEMSNLSKRLKINICGLSQLNRNVEHRRSQEPVMSDLSESGKVEESCDRVMLLYRDEYYTHGESENPNTCSVILGKNRFGECGTVMLHFKKECTKFGNLRL